MRSFALLAVSAAILSVGTILPSNAEAGCHRLGETGYGIVIVGGRVGSTRTIASSGTAIVGTVDIAGVGSGSFK
ncbi:hypothetical protein LQG66_17545 [Bradyrhizobium ontarionense]|uniref:Uncharacterized protein n=1 Tax=Bradyrhizobium ontarionense TaxID=2898149 RepID=A0ABY3RKH2_9BRAD|nr:hypothetical protein [Bradyrhizobium sp. A19]UFZ07990.1 hypothetical protein LQG66_17545 [Bradyrhizobium sp. A19]